jgi:hypothetical protein
MGHVSTLNPRDPGTEGRKCHHLGRVPSGKLERFLPTVAVAVKVAATTFETLGVGYDF